MHYSKKAQFWQKIVALQEGFLCIELLQGLLVLGMLLLVISGFYLLSVHWQHQAIKRLQALDLLSTALVKGHLFDQTGHGSMPIVRLETRRTELTEFSALLGKTVAVDRKIATASWRDEWDRSYSIRIVS